MLMTCRHATQLVTDDLEGRLDGFRKARFRFHMRLCSGCRTYRDQLERTIHVVSKLPHEEPPPEATARLVEEFRRRRAGKDG